MRDNYLKEYEWPSKRNEEAWETKWWLRLGRLRCRLCMLFRKGFHTSGILHMKHSLICCQTGSWNSIDVQMVPCWTSTYLVVPPPHWESQTFADIATCQAGAIAHCWSVCLALIKPWLHRLHCRNWAWWCTAIITEIGLEAGGSGVEVFFDYIANLRTLWAVRERGRERERERQREINWLISNCPPWLRTRIENLSVISIYKE